MQNSKLFTSTSPSVSRAAVNRKKMIRLLTIYLVLSQLLRCKNPSTRCNITSIHARNNKSKKVCTLLVNILQKRLKTQLFVSPFPKRSKQLMDYAARSKTFQSIRVGLITHFAVVRHYTQLLQMNRERNNPVSVKQRRCS